MGGASIGEEYLRWAGAGHSKVKYMQLHQRC